MSDVMNAMGGPQPGPAFADDTRRVPVAGVTSGTATGSWAASTHSAVWLTRPGGPSAASLSDRPVLSSLAGLGVVLAVTLMGAANLIDVYGDPAAWVVAAVPAAIIGCLVALAGLPRHLRLWWQVVFLVIAQFVAGPLVALNGTAVAHVLPTPDTLSRGFTATFGSFKYLIAIEPPVGTGDGSLMAVWTLCLWTSFLAGAAACVDDARPALAALAVPVLAALFAACALLGTDSGFLRLPAGVASALLLMVWLSWRWHLAEFNRWASCSLIVLLAGALAVGSCLLVPQHRLTLRDRYEPPISPYQYTSPLSGMRAYVKDHKDDTLLTVTGLPESTPVRLAVMDAFDGNVWNLSDSSASSSSSDYRRVGASIDTDADGERFTATFTVDKGMGGYWLPLAGAATGVDFSTSAKGTTTASGSAGGTASETGATADSFYYNKGTWSAIMPVGLTQGMSYTETGVLPATPTDRQVDEAQATDTDQPEAVDVPDSADKLATSIAGGKATGGQAAKALADTLSQNGWFSHGLTGDYPSLPGHGNHRVNELLSGTAMVGDSEQYASAMALMARQLGLPSRVVLGFLPKDKDGRISAARTKTKDGKPTVEFTGNDIEAWVEIDLEGYGWTAFYPTPKETKVPDKDQDLTPPDPQTLVRQPPVPLTDPLRDETQSRGQSALAGTDADDSPTNLMWAHVARIAARVALWGSPVWVPALICALILLAKALALSRLRRRGDGRARVANGWRALRGLAEQSGVMARGTRREQAASIATQLGIDPGVLATLGREADYAAFSGQEVSAAMADAYWERVAGARKAMLGSQPWPRRMRTRLSLRGAFPRSDHGRNILGARRNPTVKAQAAKPAAKEDQQQ